jgi:hypothetical protein
MAVSENEENAAGQVDSKALSGARSWSFAGRRPSSIDDDTTVCFPEPTASFVLLRLHRLFGKGEVEKA